MGNTIEVSLPDGTVETAVATLQGLIRFPSVSSTSNLAITDHCAAILQRLGFQVERTEYTDARGVRKANLVARRDPVSPAAVAQPGLAYFCHTDVVPAESWRGAADAAAGAFEPTLNAGRLYARGACDMKGSLATMLAAVARLELSEQRAPLWIVCTADEEVGFAGAKHLVAHCPGYRRLVDADPVALIGEPTELNVVYAHKGICGFRVCSQGRAGHSATAEGINANEAMVPMLVKLNQLCQRSRQQSRWQDDRFDPPTLSWNFGVSDHCDVINITPAQSEAWVSLRPMPTVDGADLMEEAEQEAVRLGLQFQRLDGSGPLWSPPESEHVQQLQRLAGTKMQTVCYCTDGGVLEELSRRVVIGPGSIRQAHTVDEWIAIDQIRRGIDVYHRALQHWCT
jgi:acetylornithine deacetylase